MTKKTLGTRLYSGRNAASAQVEVEPKVFYKSICFLLAPTWDCVPRGKVKVDLIKKGLFIDVWAVNKNWNERELRTEITKLFQSALCPGIE